MLPPPSPPPPAALTACHRAFEALNFSDTDDNAIITFEEFSAALQRLQFSLEEAGVRALFQSCARGGSGMMFGEFCAWCCTPSPPLHSHSPFSR